MKYGRRRRKLDVDCVVKEDKSSGDAWGNAEIRVVQRLVDRVDWLVNLMKSKQDVMAKERKKNPPLKTARRSQTRPLSSR